MPLVQNFLDFTSNICPTSPAIVYSLEGNSLSIDIQSSCLSDIATSIAMFQEWSAIIVEILKSDPNCSNPDNYPGFMLFEWLQSEFSINSTNYISAIAIFATDNLGPSFGTVSQYFAENDPDAGWVLGRLFSTMIYSWPQNSSKNLDYDTKIENVNRDITSIPMVWDVCVPSNGFPCPAGLFLTGIGSVGQCCSMQSKNWPAWHTTFGPVVCTLNPQETYYKISTPNFQCPDGTYISSLSFSFDGNEYQVGCAETFC